jgi:hypothetical protein
VSEKAPAGLLLTFARRGEDDAILQAIARLREHGAAEVAAVGTPASAPALRELGVGDIILYGEGHGARAVIGKLRRRRPRTAAIVYWDSGFAGHLKLEALALLTGAKHVLRVAPNSQTVTIGRFRLAWIVFLKCLLACVCTTTAAAICGIAFLCLRARQVIVGGSNAGRV